MILFVHATGGVGKTLVWAGSAVHYVELLSHHRPLLSVPSCSSMVFAVQRQSQTIEFKSHLGLLVLCETPSSKMSGVKLCRLTSVFPL